MLIDYAIAGSIIVPEGTKFSENNPNLLILPDGKTISIQPIIELNTSEDADEHRNINYKEATELGVYQEDYIRRTDHLLSDDDTLETIINILGKK